MKKQQKFTFKELFGSKRFKNNYQIDMAKVVLGEKAYTVDEAERILNAFFNKTKRKEK